jgi:apolipoprotein N-acyltransferase
MTQARAGVTHPSARRRLLLHATAIVVSAALLALYARGGHAHLLGFVMLVPWLLALNATRSVVGAGASALLMSVGIIVAVFTWFGAALHAYTGIGALPATLLLCGVAPLLQPQVVAFAIVRQLVGRRSGPWLGALAGASAWVGCEWLWPKLLGDTLGHGLLPSLWLRQAADLGGAAGLSVVLILVNEAIAIGATRARTSARAAIVPFALALLLPASLLVYGALRLDALRSTLDAPAPVMRIGLVQSGIVDYERLRDELGTYGVVREVLDTHFALSRAAIEHHGADALLWSETVYPTTFGHPRSEDGAALDREILDFVTAVGVPLLFGTYDLDGHGEYNAAALIEPRSGVLGRYRKTYPFPLTEHVPPWMDGALLRRWLPWAGTWAPGDGARVLPLRAADGRELNIVPLICLDDVRPGLAIDGARLGAQAIVGLSNDSWFSRAPLGAQLHLGVAAFRSIETRLPQVRVTNNGLSAIIDPTGEILVSTAMGDRAVLAGEVSLRDPPGTLMRRWGDWVGGAGLSFLLLILLTKSLGAWRRFRAARSDDASTRDSTRAFTAEVMLLDSVSRSAVAALRVAAAVGLLWLAVRMLWIDGLQVNALIQLKIFAWLVLAPLIATWAIQRLFAARAGIESGRLVLQQLTRRVEIPLERIVALRPWRWPLPMVGVDLMLASGRRLRLAWRRGDPDALTVALRAAGATLAPGAAPAPLIARLASARLGATSSWLDRPWLKFGIYPLLLALPAFRLHQNIAFGDTFGEWYTYGASAWLTGLLIWWASWAIGLMLFGAAIRLAIELIALVPLPWLPAHGSGTRRHLERIGRLIFYASVPAWLLLRLLSG